MSGLMKKEVAAQNQSTMAGVTCSSTKVTTEANWSSLRMRGLILATPNLPNILSQLLSINLATDFSSRVPVLPLTRISNLMLMSYLERWLHKSNSCAWVLMASSEFQAIMGILQFIGSVYWPIFLEERQNCITPSSAESLYLLMYEVEEILDRRFNPKTNTVQYLVHWSGYGKQESTWEPEKNLKFVKNLIQKFHERGDVKGNMLPDKTSTKVSHEGNQEQDKKLSLFFDEESDDSDRKSSSDRSSKPVKKKNSDGAAQTPATASNNNPAKLNKPETFQQHDKLVRTEKIPPVLNRNTVPIPRTQHNPGQRGAVKRPPQTMYPQSKRPAASQGPYTKMPPPLPPDFLIDQAEYMHLSTFRPPPQKSTRIPANGPPAYPGQPRTMPEHKVRIQHTRQDGEQGSSKPAMMQIKKKIQSEQALKNIQQNYVRANLKQTMASVAPFPSLGRPNHSPVPRPPPQHQPNGRLASHQNAIRDARQMAHPAKLGYSYQSYQDSTDAMGQPRPIPKSASSYRYDTQALHSQKPIDPHPRRRPQIAISHTPAKQFQQKQVQVQIAPEQPPADGPQVVRITNMEKTSTGSLVYEAQTSTGKQILTREEVVPRFSTQLVEFYEQYLTFME